MAGEETGQTPNVGEQERVRQEHWKALKDRYDPDRVPFSATHSMEEIHAQYGALQNEERGSETVRAAGRIMALRLHGKAAFGDLVSQSGKIQIYFKQDLLGEDGWKIFELMDLGDILGIEGAVFRTRRGELSLQAAKLFPIVKCLHPLPEKWHGLKDVEIRYRQRYLDLIVSAEARETFLLRSRLLAKTRYFLDHRGFYEVETPVMSSIAGGAEAKPFSTHHHAHDMELHLRIATELYLKRLVVGGFEKVYEIGRVFRNEGISTRHNPEFTTLELYEAYSDYHGMMRLIEELLVFLADELLKSRKIPHPEEAVSLEPPFSRITYADALKQYGNLNLEEILNFEKAKETARRLKLSLDPKSHLGQYIGKIFEAVVEPHLIQPTFILDYPIVISPLAKRNLNHPNLADRFELFIQRMEIANAFSELNDPADQRERFVKQSQLREAGDEEAHVMDEDFLRALEYGMPPTGGLGIGIDRLCMLFSRVASIREVILFPLLKPKHEEPPAAQIGDTR